MSGWLLWATLDVFILDCLWFPARDLPNPVQGCNLTHDEAFDRDVALQLKLMLGIPASLWPQDQPFPVTQTGPQTNQRGN